MATRAHRSVAAVDDDGAPHESVHREVSLLPWPRDVVVVAAAAGDDPRSHDARSMPEKRLHQERPHSDRNAAILLAVAAERQWKQPRALHRVAVVARP